MAYRDWIRIAPAVAAGGSSELLAETAAGLAGLDSRSEDGLARLQRMRQRALEKALSYGNDAQHARVRISVLCDLRGQGWEIRSNEDGVHIRPPAKETEPSAEKARVRADLLVERDQQLREDAVRHFVTDMERRYLGPAGRWVSVFSLMRDGAELADDLRAASAAGSEAEQLAALQHVIRPYIQVVDDGACEHTGLRLKDIWRYFRHTWASPHKSLPGRNIWFLVRDAAAPFHPVIGIAALGSAVVQLAIRDRWMGWSRERFIERLQDAPNAFWAGWVADRLTEQIDAIYVADFTAAGQLQLGDLVAPTVDLISRLRGLADVAREKHRLHGSSKEHKSVEDDASVDWEERARTDLFKWKRASTLAELLEDVLRLRAAGFDEPSAEKLQAALRSAEGRQAIGRILRRVKAAHVGIDILDITVCGAVAPYNHLLGGKLVSLLLASPEVRLAYERRYAERSSVIASAMAGRSVQRRPQLVLLGTTSLYGAGSSQYNRIRMPAVAAGGKQGEVVEYVELGTTEGYGSFHFSSVTLREIRMLLAQTSNGRRVRHIFGEGANPRMREVREALDKVGLPSDRLLRHGSSRIVYAVPLATNAREVLLKADEQPKYLVPGDEPAQRTRDIVNYWMTRWLVNRVRNERVLKQVGQHVLAYPIDHGGRVVLPPGHEDTPLFTAAWEE